MNVDETARLMANVATVLQQQQELMQQLAARPPPERKVEGISMPTYSGQLGESLELFLDQARLFFEAKNIDYTHADNTRRVLAMMVSNLKGQAAAWYITQQSSVTNIDELADALRLEFIPADLQERLRDALYSLKQRECKDLAEYVTKYRQLISRVEDMSELDKITLFTRGLVSQTRSEVVYRRCQSVHSAISVAMEYERSHPQTQSASGSRPAAPPRVTQASPRPSDNPEPMEIGQTRFLSRQECRRRNLCFFCKSPGHRMANCPRRSGHAGGQPHGGRREPRTERQRFHAMAERPTAPVSIEVFDRMTINAVVLPSESRANQLFRVAGEVNGHIVTILLDSGADHNVIRPGLTPNVVRQKRVIAERFDGTTTEERTIREVLATVFFNGYKCSMEFSEWELSADQDVIFGKPWFSKYNPDIDWVNHKVKLSGENYALGYLLELDLKYMASVPEDVSEVVLASLPPDDFGDPDIADEEVSEAQLYALVNYATAPGTSFRAELDALDAHLASDRVPTAVATFGEVLDAGPANEHRIEVNTASISEVPEFLSCVVKEFGDCFPDRLPDALPKERAVEFELQMKPDARPSSRAPFRLSQTEQKALCVFVDELLQKQWIELSDSPWVSNIFGVPKKDVATGSAPSRAAWIRSGNSDQPVRWVVDYRYINSQTEVPRIPLPRIDDLFDRMVGCSWFTTIDLAQGYHQMRVHPDSRKYTAFRTDQETYQWCVAPMGLSGMPGVWSRLMRFLFGRFDFVVVYLDDLCIFSRTQEEHARHLRAVFEVLRSERLYARRSKCVFGARSVNFLGHTVSSSGLEVDRRKTEAIERILPPTSVKELMSFLGLAGYYRRFIYNYAEIVLPLSDLVKKKCPWVWGPAQERAFKMLKVALQQSPVLALPDFDRQFVVTTDASGSCVGGVLSQFDPSTKADKPIAFLSKKLSDAEKNWPTHEKELFAIKLCLAKWRHYLHGRQFDVFTDNAACRWFMSHPSVSSKLARWLAFFGQFHFVLHHIKGSTNVVADALSRPPADMPTPCDVPVVVSEVAFHECDHECAHKESQLRCHRVARVDLRTLDDRDLGLLVDEDFRGEKGRAAAIDVKQTITRSNVNTVQLAISSVMLDTKTRKWFERAYLMDPAYKHLVRKSSKQPSNDVNSCEMVLEDGLIYKQEGHAVRRLCVPNDDRLRTKLISEYHDGPMAAHPGSRRTALKLAMWFFWATLDKDVRSYVKSCATCARFKSSSLRKNGSLMPLPVPSECWEIVGLDFITGLPVSDGFDAIMTCIDRLSKRPKYVATHSSASAIDTARLFFDSVVRNHGLPQAIVSDRDSKFTSDFWSELMRLMGVQLNMTTSYRPQADGQVERQNRVLEDALRCMVSIHGSDWSGLLGAVEFAHATLENASTKFSPFEIDTGRRARSPIAAATSRNNYAENFAEHRRKIIQAAQDNLKSAQERMKQYYDRSRSSVKFTAGDMVYLSTKNLPIAHATKGTQIDKEKLSARHIGPFRITKMLNDNVARLALPKSMSRLNNSFNVDVLRHSVECPERFLSRPLPKVSPVHFTENDDSDLHDIERLVRRRIFNRQPEYLVKWHGLPDSENSWERERDIKHVVHWKALLKDLRERERQVSRG